MPAESVSPEYDYELQSEESRWLRRRFLWYCALSLLLSLPLLPFILRAATQRTADANGARVMLVGELLSTAPYAWAFVYILRRRRMKRDAVARLTMLLSVLCGGATLALTRVQLSLDRDALFVPAEQATREAALPKNPTTAQVQIVERQRAAIEVITAPAVLWSVMAVFTIFFIHVSASALIPWTLRESALTAAAFLGLHAAFVAGDVLFNGAPKWLPLVTLVTSFTVLPGLLICWWRQWRFRRQFRLKFESKHYRKLQDELQYARQVHESCLSPQVTSGPVRLHYVYEPMRQIGGDFLFVHKSPGPEAASMSAVLLDVTGHGIAAALTVNRIVVELQRLFMTWPDASPADVLGVLNEYVHATLASHGLYATGICLKIDASARSLHWANAGHPTAYIRRGDGRIESLESTAMMLGVAPWTEGAAEIMQTSLGADDAVIAYTDGAAEACNESGEALGIIGIRDAIEAVSKGGTPPGDWPAAILQRVRAHRPAPPEDDLLVAAAFCGA